MQKIMGQANEKFRKFKDLHINLLKDPEDAKAYLAAALKSFEEDGDKRAFLLALSDIAAASNIQKINKV